MSLLQQLKSVVNKSGKTGDRELVIWGVALEVALLAFWAYSGVWRGSGRLIAGFFLPGIVFFLLAWRVLRAPATPVTWKSRLILLGFAALFHLTLLFTLHPLSNDLYRYYWDGKLLSCGINPYTYPPAAAELTSYRDATWQLIFNRDVPTGYPPLAELLFAAAFWLFHDPWALRWMAAAASLGTAALLLLSLRSAGMDERRVVLYAWSPLVALEFANSGHLDAYALLFMSAALFLEMRRQPGIAAVCLALGGLVKFFPILLLPVWGRHWGKTAWLIFILIFCLPWLPFLAGGSPFKGLVIFASRGDFNNSLYRLVEEAWYLVLHSAYARLWARGTIFTLFASFCLIRYFRLKDHSDRLAGWEFAASIFGMFLILSPVVHPWYIIWMLAFIAIQGSASWLVLAVTVIFARFVYIGYEQYGIWQEDWWPWLAVWIPFYFSWAVAKIGVWKGFFKMHHRMELEEL